MSSQNEKEELNTFIDEFLIIDKKIIEEGEKLEIMKSKIFLEKIEKSICQIIKDKEYGLGFFSKIKYPNKFNEIYCLITNNHIITKDMLINNKNIEIKINNKNIKIQLNLYRGIWTNIDRDFTCIEILKEDNIIEIINPFEIDDNIYNSNDNFEEYDKRGIAIPSLGIKKELIFSKGFVYYIKNKKNKKLIYHNCDIKSENSYGPIILLNNLKIIGINKENKKNKKMKKGLYFKEIIENINEDNKIHRKSIINCILDIDLKENENIIFNQNENNKEKISDNVSVFLKNKRINLKMKKINGK